MHVINIRANKLFSDELATKVESAAPSSLRALLPASIAHALSPHVVSIHPHFQIEFAYVHAPSLSTSPLPHLSSARPPLLLQCVAPVPVAPVPEPAILPYPSLTSSTPFWATCSPSPLWERDSAGAPERPATLCSFVRAGVGRERERDGQ